MQLPLPKIQSFYLFFLLVFLLIDYGYSAPLAWHKVEGYITDNDTKKPIAGANISIRAIGVGAFSDSTGYFVMRVPQGRYDVFITSVGYKLKVRNIEVKDKIRLDVELNVEVKQLEEVIVTGKTADHNVKEAQVGNIQLDIAQLQKTPIVLGEPDIIKTLILQPGVNTVGEGAGGFNVRGGRADQNLVLIDGAPIFNTSHLLGFFSNVSPDAVQEVNLYKGHISPQYGGRVSALLDMKSKNGNEEGMSYTGGVSPMSLRLFADGKVAKNLTMVAGGRIAYPNWIINLLPEEFNQNKAFFYDTSLKLNYKLNEKNRLSLFVYRSFDNFKFPEDTLYRWNNDIASFQWRSALSKKISVNFSAIHSGYKYDIEGLKPFLEFVTTSSIQHRELKLDFSYLPSEKFTVDFGGSTIWYSLSPASRKPNGGESSINPLTLQNERARESAFYANTNWEVADWLSLQVGLRYSYFSQVGQKDIFSYQEGQPKSLQTIIDTVSYQKGEKIVNYGGLEPRAVLRIGLDDFNALKISYNRSRQYLHLISNTTAITPVDFWKVSDQYIPPQLSSQYSIGFYRNFKENEYEASVEGYYKDLQNLVEYKNNAVLLLNPAIETDILRAVGRAYGVELSIKKNKGKIYGQASYTYSRSLVAVQTSFSQEQINEGEYFPSNFDRPHNLNITAIVPLGIGWTFTSNFTYSTGRPATYPDGLYRLENALIVDFAFRNRDRIPDYHRLDISFSKDTRRSREQKRYHVWNVAFYNLYGRRNPYSIFIAQSGAVARPYRLSVFGTVIPSVTWNFHF
jgi:hypothetical protein